MDSQLLWFLSRASGAASTVLLTAVVILGVVTASRRAPRAASSALLMGLHRTLSLGMVAFLVVHIASAILDSYVDLGWLATVVPFVSGYETFWIGLGTLSVDILIAIVATSLLRHRISERVWHVVHLLSWVMWPVALVHGFMLGTADEPLLRYVSLLCGALGLGALAWRASTVNPDAERRREALTKEWS